jgi:hypothetical protein
MKRPSRDEQIKRLKQKIGELVLDLDIFKEATKDHPFPRDRRGSGGPPVHCLGALGPLFTDIRVPGSRGDADLRGLGCLGLATQEAGLLLSQPGVMERAVQDRGGEDLVVEDLAPVREALGTGHSVEFGAGPE